MRQRLLCLLACALPALATPPPDARADHPRPYKGAFEFATVDVQVLSPTEVLVTGSLAGKETILGRFDGLVLYIVDLSTETFSGSAVKRAADGDLLFETLTGQFTATGSEGTFVVTGGTGRFSEATGGGTFTGVWTDAAMTTAHITFNGRMGLDEPEGDD
ncbi:MAG TPA: hypothetical protein VG406_19355 [Isosphaeraceae bacterium]|jgi:hypothetical protein|nr:hypothetical protein [Isosphaeraceae bacterium]